MKLSLAIQTSEAQPVVPVSLLSGTFEEKLAKAAGLGFDGVELMVVEPAGLDAHAIRASLAQNRLAAAAIGSGAVGFSAGLTLLHADPGVADRARSRLNDLIGFAAAVGAPVVTVGSFRGRLASVGSGGRERLVAVLRAAATSAAECGIRLALEPLNRYESDIVNNTDEALEFIREVGHPALGLVLDTYHVNIEERTWTGPFRRAMDAGSLWHVHLGDNNRLPPGQGLIDFPAIVATLRDTGYAGFLSAELLALPDPDTAARQTATFMRAIMED